MTEPKNFWRFSYDSEESLREMLSGGTLQAPQIRLAGGKYDPNSFIEKRIKSGDGIVLARFDSDNAIGEVVAIGIVQNQKPASLVAWKAVTFPLHPSPQGGIAMWKKEVCFRIDEAPAKRYQLAARFAKHFAEPIIPPDAAR